MTEKNIMQIMILDHGIILFNAKPKDGIAFLIKNKMVTEDPLDIAKFLATTDKVDKHVLGNFLGKDNEYSLAILNKFASLFHYEGVPFDVALRSFTSRFAMPGESQMIYRILERFSVYYSQSNPSIDKDKALIFSYALIMLNVDLHSSRIKAKMTKEEFVKNTESALGNCVSRTELENIYIRVLANELKPATSAEEIVYSKLAINPKYATKSNDGKVSDTTNPGKTMEAITIDEKARLETIKRGAVLLKYGREGSPHPRKVFLSPDGKKLCWIDPKRLAQLESRVARQQLQQIGDGSPGRVSAGSAGSVTGGAPTDPAAGVDQKERHSSVFGKVCVGSCLNRVVGSSSGSFRVDRSKALPRGGDYQGSQLGSNSAPPISLVLHGNDLDILRSVYVRLRARGPVAAESFRRSISLEDVTGLVVGTGGTRNFRKHFTESALADAETEQRCFSIITDYRTLDLQAPASVDITPWLQFFHQVLSDREKRLRAAADKNKDIWMFTQKERASLVRWQEIVPQWSEHWNCGARVSAGGGYRASQHPKEELLNHRMFLVNTSGFVLDRGQRLETAVSPTLVALWLEGIPSSVRPRVWPIAVGNQLRLDEKFCANLFRTVGQTLAGGTANLNVSLGESLAGGDEESRPADESTISPKWMKELERELKSSSMRKFANRALAWIDARGSREQQAFFKPGLLNQLLRDVVRGAETCGTQNIFSNERPVSLESIVAGPPAEEDSVVSPPKEIISMDTATAVPQFETNSEDSWDSGENPMSSGWDNVELATRILVVSFLEQRKDIRFTRGMAHLAAMVIFNIGVQDLWRSFAVYTNVLHQFHFLDFFTMNWRDMRMRFDLYGKLIRERMPYLDDHFSAIQISPDLYFNQWLLTGFTRILPFRTACRVWDGFLLLGESYLFTAALAFLNYNEHSLMTSGFSGCLELLLGHADEVLFNDRKYFECVHAQSVSNERFAAWISAQRLAEEKTALYDLLLLM